MLEKFFNRFRQDKGIPPRTAASPAVNIEGLEDKIKVPQPTADDRRWAQKLRRATTSSIGTALGGAIAANQNWRVWYLLNRPQRKSTGIISAPEDLGFKGNRDAVAEGLAKAAEHNNVTAAYLLLKYAEENHKNPGAAHTPPLQCTADGLESAAGKKGPEVFQLLARSLATLLDPDMQAGSAKLIDYQDRLKKSAIAAAAQGNTAHLDALADTGLLQGAQMVDAFMKSFETETHYPDLKDPGPAGRETFLSWLSRRGIVDAGFAEEAQAVNVRVTDARETLQRLSRAGWRLSQRVAEEDLPVQGLQAEIALREGRRSVVYLFNENASRIHRFDGPAVRDVTPAKLPDAQLAEDAKQFLAAAQIRPPELLWKKGEPFRLRFNGPK